MNIGDKVVWESQGQGFTRQKVGEIVAVIPPRRNPNFHIPEGKWSFGGGSFGLPRNHESYLVAVGNRLYWPRVASLRKV